MPSTPMAPVDESDAMMMLILIMRMMAMLYHPVMTSCLLDTLTLYHS